MIDSFTMLYSIIYCSTIILYLLLCDKTMYVTCTVYRVTHQQRAEYSTMED